MISLTIWLVLWSSLFVLAPPSLSSNDRQYQSLAKKTYIVTPANPLNNKSIVLGKRRKIKLKQTTIATTTTSPDIPFDMTHYRSSWRFVSRDTIRVRFRLYESFIRSISSASFFVRHTHTGHIRIYKKPDEIINSTINLYLQDIEHGKHAVCLLINLSSVFCQDIIFNFHKYGQHDGETDEHENKFVFLLTQYAIVCGILCILQLVYMFRKRRLVKVLSHKANTLRHALAHHHYHSQEDKSASGMPGTRALDHLIFNMNKMALLNLDNLYTETNNMPNDSPVHQPRSPLQATSDRKYLSLPNQSSKNGTPLLVRYPSSTMEIPDSANPVFFEEIEFDSRSCEEQSISLKSVAHILDANKPWTARLTDDGSVKHSLASNNRVFSF